jgi:hypothetical protein
LSESTETTRSFSSFLAFAMVLNGKGTTDLAFALGGWVRGGEDFPGRVAFPCFCCGGDGGVESSNSPSSGEDVANRFEGRSFLLGDVGAVLLAGVLTIRSCSWGMGGEQ